MARTIGCMRGKQPRPAAKRILSDDTTRKAKVTEEHRREAEQLKSLFDAFQKRQKDRGVRVTQGGFGADHGIGDQALVWQYLNARIPLNLRAAAGFAKGLGCTIEQFSPRLAKDQADVAPPEAKAAARAPRTALQSVLELNYDEQILLGLYRELKGAQQEEVMQLAQALHVKTHPHPSPANPFAAGGKKQRETKHAKATDVAEEGRR